MPIFLEKMLTKEKYRLKVNPTLVLFTIMLSLLLAGVMTGQSQYVFEHLSLEKGVAHNLAFCILQDSRGFIWFGTMFGLVKYDGYSYTTYRHNPDDTNSLSNDDIVTLVEDKHGNLWIGTYGGGVNKLDRSSGKILRITERNSRPTIVSEKIVWSICEDHTGALWFGTNGGGIDRFDPASHEFSHYRHEPSNSNSVSENIVFSIVEDSLGFLWIGTQSSGVDKLDPSRKIFTHFRTDPQNPSSISSDNIRKLYFDNDGQLWICTHGGGVNMYLGGENGFRHYIHDPTNPYSLNNDYVNTIAQDIRGIYWFGTVNGLDRFDPRNLQFTHFTHQASNANSISSNEIVALVVDKSGLLWIGSYHGGVDKLYTGKRRFNLFNHNPDDSTSLSDNTIHSIKEDHDGVLWIGTNKGLNRFDDSSGTFQHFFWDPKKPNTLSGHIVNAITEDSFGNLWIGTRRGLSILNKKRTSFTYYRHDGSQPQSLSNDNITAILASRLNNSEIWIGTANGLDRFDTDTKIFTHFAHADSDSTTLSDNSILSIYEDKAGTLWFGTFGGLNKLDRKKNQFEHFIQDPYDSSSLSNNYCLSILEDRSGTLWIGTGGGLNRLDHTSRTFTHFTRKHGLPNGVICGIIENEDGVFWISTNAGLSKFESHTQSFTNYDISDGLQSNMFSVGAFCKRKNGQGVFGGFNGFNVTNTDSLPQSTFIPPVAITSFMVFDNTNKDFASLQKPFSSVKLSYKENSFAIAFASLDFTHSEKNQYAFKLEGFDKDWVYAGYNRFARYMNLSPGEYIFRAKGSNIDGVWNEKGTELRIVITPPFWMTWWFYSISALAMVGSVILVYNYRVKEKVKRLIELDRVRNEENKLVRKRAADDFHDEFGHKLTKISLLSQVIKRTMGESFTEPKQHLDKIVQTSNELSMGMRDFLWTLNPDKDSAYDVAIRLKDFGDELFNNSGIGFRMNGITKDLERVQLAVDWRRHLTLLFKEAMNNVVKHSACHDVTLDIVQYNGSIDIRLTDDGIGFRIEDCPIGQGLPSMRNRAEKIGGTLHVETECGKGTSVRFTGIVPVYPLNNGRIQ